MSSTITRVLLLLLVCCAPAMAQYTPPTQPSTGSGAPAGTCAPNALYVNTANGNLYSCSSGSWVLSGGGGSSPGGSTGDIQFANSGGFANANTIFTGSTASLDGTGTLRLNVPGSLFLIGAAASQLQAQTNLSLISVTGAITLSSANLNTLGTSSNQLNIGLVGAAGALGLVGSTSGTATITAPAVAGTTSNPVVFSNAISVPSCTGCLPTLPTSPNGVAQLLGSTPSGGVGVAPVWSLSGVPVDATNPATLLVTDRANYLNWTSGTALALPAVATSFASNFPFVIKNTSTTLTITPNAGASDLIDGAASGTLIPNFASFVYQDSTSAPGHWFTVKFPTFAAFGSNCGDATHALNWSTTTGFGCQALSGGGGGLSGMTAGQIPVAATASTVTSSVAVQGTDTKLLSSGTVSGTGAALCTDANAGATTSGCPANGSYAPAAPQTDTNDTWAANNATCIAAANCPFVTHITFPGAATSGTLDGTHVATTVHWLMNVTGSNSPTFTYYLKACATANYTAGVDATTLPICSSGQVTLYQSATAAVSTSIISTSLSVDIFATVGGTAGTFVVARTGSGSLANTANGGTGVIACGATCTGGTWVIYPVVQYSAATAGNTITTTGFYAPYIY